MVPIFNDGDYAVSLRVSLTTPVRIGNIVQIMHDEFGPIVKQIKCLRPGFVLVQGCSSLSIVENQLGWIAASKVSSRLVLRISKQGIKLL